MRRLALVIGGLALLFGGCGGESGVDGALDGPRLTAEEREWCHIESFGDFGRRGSRIFQAAMELGFDVEALEQDWQELLGPAPGGSSGSQRPDLSDEALERASSTMLSENAQWIEACTAAYQAYQE